MAGEGSYHKALAHNKRRLKDYQEVHFRRRTVCEGTSSGRFRHVPTSARNSISEFSTSSSNSGTRTGITLAPRRTSRAQLEDFNPSTASLHLRQTEGVWLCSHLSRQEATASLFNRPIGTFIVRNSQKARYALSVRVPKDDPAVSHFLIESNQQGFLTIQGSNLPFLSIYDLLAYFCFYKSGGMPCYLAKPVSNAHLRTVFVEDSSADSSESDEDLNENGYNSRGCDLTISPPASSPPPLVPPHQSPRLVPGPAPQNTRLHPLREEIFIDSHKQSDYRLRRSPSPQSPPPSSRGTRKQAPPKPPRGSTLLEEEDVFPPAEARRVIRKVDSIVDMDSKDLYQSYRKIGLKEGGEKGAGPQTKGRLQRRLSWSSDDLRKRKRKVNSLVQMFENGETLVGEMTGASPPTFRHRIPERGVSSPALPPRPSRPSLPPKPSFSGSGDLPVVPPHTPAPVVPPRPAGSKAPFVPSRERASSDSMFPVKSRPPPPPPGDPVLPPLRPPKPGLEAHYEFDQELRERLAAARRRAAETEGVEGGRSLMERLTESTPAPTRVNGIAGAGGGVREGEISTSTASEGGGGKERTKSKKRGWPKKLPKFYRKPRKKIRKFIIDTAGDPSQDFGKMVGDFVSDIKSRCKEPYQKLLSEIRNFMTQLHDYLLQHHHQELADCGMESCSNFEHVVETSLQQCVLGPLSLYVYLGIEEHLMEGGSLFQVQRSVHQGKHKTPQEMGIREHLAVPGEKVISEIGGIFSRMTKTYCAISKLEFLLEAVRLTYENVRDSKNPKKSMNDLGADDFLPLFVWVLVQSGFTRAEIEAEYMWGLAHPSLFNGEAGYYLTTLTSAINVLKETQPAVPAFPRETEGNGDNIEEQIQNLPCMNNLQTELKIFFEDASTGQYSSAYRLAVVPDMTVAEVCDVIAQKHCKANPERYGLFTVVDGQVLEMGSEEKPQEVKKRWALEKSTSAGNNKQPSTRFMAYRLKQTK